MRIISSLGRDAHKQRANDMENRVCVSVCMVNKPSYTFPVSFQKPKPRQPDRFTMSRSIHIGILPKWGHGECAYTIKVPEVFLSKGECFPLGLSAPHRLPIRDPLTLFVPSPILTAPVPGPKKLASLTISILQVHQQSLPRYRYLRFCVCYNMNQ